MFSTHDGSTGVRIDGAVSRRAPWTRAECGVAVCLGERRGRVRVLDACGVLTRLACMRAYVEPLVSRRGAARIWRRKARLPSPQFPAIHAREIFSRKDAVRGLK